MKLKTLISLLLLVFLCGSCTKAELTEKPKNLLSVEEVENVLVDMYINQQAYQILPLSSDELRDLRPINSNKAVLDKHKIKMEDFEDSFKYYSVKPTIYNEILDRVEEKLKNKLPVSVEKIKKE